MESNNFDRKKFLLPIIFAFLLMLAGFVLVMMFMVSFAGIDGLIKTDVAKGWIIIAVIPMILGPMMMWFLLVYIQKKEAEFNLNSENASEESLEQPIRAPVINYQKIKLQNLLMGFLALFFGMLIVYFILGKSNWAEFIDVIL